MTQTLLAADPGKNAIGNAYFVREGPGSPWKLVHAYCTEAYPVEGLKGSEHGFLQPMQWKAAAQAAFDVLPAPPTFLALEIMVVYPKGGGDPRDLLMLQGVSGALTGMCTGSKCIGMEPRSWKNQVPREILGNRIEKKLRDSGQFDLVVSKPRLKTHLNDICHAVGLGQVVIERRLPDILFPC
jgi:hypothetical protein